jgi:hypothetical protein
MKRHLIQAAEGALGGVAGTFLMQKQMGLMGKLPERYQPHRMKGDPAEYVVSRAEDLAGRRIPLEHRDKAKHSTHWIYGVGWGVLLGALAPAFDLRSPGRAVAAGAAMGAGVWAIGHAGWLPRAGLVDPIKQQEPKRMLAPVLSHVLYGIACALPIFLIERFREPKLTRWQRFVARFC